MNHLLTSLSTRAPVRIVAPPGDLISIDGALTMKKGGDVMVVPLGGSVALYVIENDESVTRQVAEVLQTSDFAGVVFSRIPIEGTFPLADVRLGITNIMPDIVFSMRWTAELNANGTPGMLISEGGTKKGRLAG